MPAYQTERLERYPVEFRRVAEDLFARVSNQLGVRKAKRHDGSYSIFGTSSKETAAKIVIYHPDIGKRSRDWPHMRDGVYVLVRANGRLAQNVWQGVLIDEMPEMFSRLWRNDTIGIRPRSAERFSYFPIVAGDDFEQLTSFLVGCSNA
jgi:hypothetical protein